MQHEFVMMLRPTFFCYRDCHLGSVRLRRVACHTFCVTYGMVQAGNFI